MTLLHAAAAPVQDAPTFRPLEENDLAAVNQMYIEEYGPNYPYPLRAVRTDCVCLVAECDGQVVGYAQAAPYEGYPGVWEFGRLIVAPAHRGRHIARTLTDLRLAQMRQRGAETAMSENVCYRADCASQWNLINHGFVLCGIQPFKYPALHCDLLGDQPESVLVAAKALIEGRDTGLGRRRVYLPQVLWELLHLFLPRRVYERGWTQQVHGAMPVHREHGPLVVGTHVGSKFVDIPINWPDAATVILAYIHAGYRFAAVLPGFGRATDGQVYDLVRLYNPPAIPLNFDLVHVAEPLSKLHAFMSREYDPR
jgi:GNAT superfamily N-acetyltransferase